ncbi:MAG: molecular chaperone DnaJ [Pseudomonadota bacterium]
MARLFVLLAALAVFYLLWRRVRALPPQRRRGEYIKLAIGGLLVIVIVLTLAGKLSWVGAAITGLLVLLRQALPLLIRYFPMLASLRGQSSTKSAQQSTVETELLRMTLDHDTGELDGEVLAGGFSGWRLADMDRAQLGQLLSWCQGRDGDSAALLDSYLQQRFPGEQFAGASSQTASSGEMNRSEALAILGLDEQATETDIVQAHRRLMQRLHPDRGGNDYLAAKVNQAKDVLLG